MDTILTGMSFFAQLALVLVPHNPACFLISLSQIGLYFPVTLPDGTSHRRLKNKTCSLRVRRPKYELIGETQAVNKFHVSQQDCL